MSARLPAAFGHVHRSFTSNSPLISHVALFVYYTCVSPSPIATRALRVRSPLNLRLFFSNPTRAASKQRFDLTAEFSNLTGRHTIVVLPHLQWNTNSCHRLQRKIQTPSCFRPQRRKHNHKISCRLRPNLQAQRQLTPARKTSVNCSFPVTVTG